MDFSAIHLKMIHLHDGFAGFLVGGEHDKATAFRLALVSISSTFYACFFADILAPKKFTENFHIANN
jgi:hypothetical protein